MSSIVDSKPKRESNIELYRVILMLLIIAHHYVFNSGILYHVLSDPRGYTPLFVLIFGAWGKVGINCFILITGFFMCKKSVSLKKYARLLAEVYFYNIIIYLILGFAGYEDFSIERVFGLLTFSSPESGRFVSSFLLFYFFIPFINILINNIDKNKHFLLILVCLLIYTIRGTIPGLEIEINYISWFIIIYFIGSYLRIYRDTLPDIFGCKAYIGVIITFLISIVSIYLGYVFFLHTRISDLYYYFVIDSNKLLAVMLAVFLFCMFLNIKIPYNKFINAMGRSTFGVLLIHANSDAMRTWLWGFIDPIRAYDEGVLVINAVISVLLIFVCTTVIDLGRYYCIEKPIFSLLDKKIDLVEKRILVKIK